jgi:tripartite-type tricarboxylate transporter receptor subunit TctC
MSDLAPPPAWVKHLLAVIVAAHAGLAGGALAQNFPAKPVRFLVGAPPGGGADFIARTLSPRLTDSFGQTVVVENRPGANGVVASELLARAAPDGYTIKINIIGDAINPALMKSNFDCLKDFAFITLAAESQNLLVAHPSFPATTVNALLALSKKQPGAIAYGSQGIGSSGHLAGELFQLMTGTRWTHVPYKGGAQALVDLIGGQISVSFGNIPTVIQQVRAGKLRAIAVTGAKRAAAVSDIPTIAESGVPGYEVSNWFGISTRAGTPPEIIARLHADIARALKTPEIRAAFNQAGADPGDMTPAEFAAFFRNETAKWAKVVQAAGIKGE